jgi:hypothetical protein
MFKTYTAPSTVRNWNHQLTILETWSSCCGPWAYHWNVHVEHIWIVFKMAGEILTALWEPCVTLHASDWEFFKAANIVYEKIHKSEFIVESDNLDPGGMDTRDRAEMPDDFNRNECPNLIVLSESTSNSEGFLAANI